MKKIFNYFEVDYDDIFGNGFMLTAVIMSLLFLFLNTVMPLKYVLGFVQEMPNADITVNGFLLVSNSIILLCTLFLYLMLSKKSKLSFSLIILILLALNTTPFCRDILFLAYLSIPIILLVSDVELNTKILFILLRLTNFKDYYFYNTSQNDYRKLDNMIVKLGFIRILVEINKNNNLKKIISFYMKNIKNNNKYDLNDTINLFHKDFVKELLIIEERIISSKERHTQKKEKRISEQMDMALSEQYKMFTSKDN